MDSIKAAVNLTYQENKRNDKFGPHKPHTLYRLRKEGQFFLFVYKVYKVFFKPTGRFSSTLRRKMSLLKKFSKSTQDLREKKKWRISTLKPRKKV